MNLQPIPNRNNFIPDAVAEVTILNWGGMQDREAMELATVADEYPECEIRLKVKRPAQGGPQELPVTDAKSIMNLMLLAATFGSDCEIQAKGPGSARAVAAIRETIQGFKR